MTQRRLEGCLGDPVHLSRRRIRCPCSRCSAHRGRTDDLGSLLGCGILICSPWEMSGRRASSSVRLRARAPLAYSIPLIPVMPRSRLPSGRKGVAVVSTRDRMRMEASMKSVADIGLRRQCCLQVAKVIRGAGHGPADTHRRPSSHRRTSPSAPVSGAGNVRSHPLLLQWRRHAPLGALRDVASMTSMRPRRLVKRGTQRCDAETADRPPDAADALPSGSPAAAARLRRAARTPGHDKAGWSRRRRRHRQARAEISRSRTGSRGRAGCRVPRRDRFCAS